MILDSLELFFGDASPAETRVYARLPAAAIAEAGFGREQPFTLRGSVIGPFCSHTRTLTATIPLVPVSAASVVSAGDTLLAEAIVPDPCFWTMDLPFIYQVSVTLYQGDKVLERTDRTTGVRPLAARGAGLVYEGQPWVLRAASAEPDEADLPLWREAQLAMVLKNPSPEFCQVASEQGVLLLADITPATDTDLLDSVRQLAKSPAVGFIALPHGAPWHESLRQVARNVVWVERFAEDAVVSPAPWADAVCIEASSVELITARSLPCGVPMIARHAVDEYVGPGELRQRCDELQRALAGKQQFAGYVV